MDTEALRIRLSNAWYRSDLKWFFIGVRRRVRNHRWVRRSFNLPRFVVWEEHAALSIEVVDTYRKSFSPDNPYAPPGRTVYAYGYLSANHEHLWEDANGVCDILNDYHDPYTLIEDVLRSSEETDEYCTQS